MYIVILIIVIILIIAMSHTATNTGGIATGATTTGGTATGATNTGATTVGTTTAIVNLAMADESYIMAACMSAHNTRKYLDKSIHLVIMVDNNFYHRFYDLLSKYYDYIHNLGELWYYPISIKQTYIQAKYSSWVSYSPNKWRCLELTQYDRILFMDIDMLILDPDFKNIF